MKPKTYGYIGGGLVAAVILAISGWGPMAAGDSSQNPVFAVDPSWPNPLPAPIGSDGAAHPWVTGEVAGSCTDKFDNVYTFNRGWEVGVTARNSRTPLCRMVPLRQPNPSPLATIPRHPAPYIQACRRSAE